MWFKRLSTLILLSIFSLEFAKVPRNLIETVVLSASNIALYSARQKLEKSPNSHDAWVKWGASTFKKDFLSSVKDLEFIKSLFTSPFFHFDMLHLNSNLIGLLNLTSLNYSAGNKGSYILPYVAIGALSRLINYETIRTDVGGSFAGGASNCVLGFMVYSLYNIIKKPPEILNTSLALLVASCALDIKNNYNTHYGFMEGAIAYILGEEVFCNLYEKSPAVAYASLAPMMAILALYIRASNNKVASGGFVNLFKKLPIINLFSRRKKVQS